MLIVIWLVIGGVIAVLLTDRKPGQIGLAIALGAIVGLIPKDNILAVMLLLAIFLLRVNLGFGIMAAALFTQVGIALEPLAERIGSVVLHSSLAESLGTLFFDLPLAAWTSLNNTIVLGEFLLGILLFYPIYRISRLIAGFFTKPDKNSPSPVENQAIPQSGP